MTLRWYPTDREVAGQPLEAKSQHGCFQNNPVVWWGVEPQIRPSRNPHRPGSCGKPLKAKADTVAPKTTRLSDEELIDKLGEIPTDREVVGNRWRRKPTRSLPKHPGCLVRSWSQNKTKQYYKKYWHLLTSNRSLCQNTYDHCVMSGTHIMAGSSELWSHQTSKKKISLLAAVLSQIQKLWYSIYIDLLSKQQKFLTVVPTIL